MLSFRKTDNAIWILKKFLKKLDVKVSSYSVTETLTDHPDYPSMISLSDSLSLWNIPNQAIRVDKETCILEELPLPFIAHLKNEGGRYVLISKITDQGVSYCDEKVTDELLKSDDFLKYWDGIFLYAEKDQLSGEANYVQAQIQSFIAQLRIPLFFLTLLSVCVYILGQQTFSLITILLFLNSIAGTLVCILLLMQGNDSSNLIVQNLCNFVKDNDCKLILKSEDAKITSWLSWSEVGFVYFAGSLICLVVNPENMFFLSWLNILALPYTFYSIIYQYRHKNWCILCCSIQILLWVSIIISWYGDLFKFDFTHLSITPIFLSYALPVSLWSFLKPNFILATQLAPLKKQLNKFKYNPVLFNHLMSTQQKYDLPEDIRPIILGNPNAETIITMVSNPFCQPCATAHTTLSKWLNERDDLQVNILFLTSNDKHDRRTLIARHIVALDSLKDRNLVEKAIDDWYQNPDEIFEKWAEKYPVEYGEEIAQIVDKQISWCVDANISKTPTLFINGQKLVEPYLLSDLRYVVN